MKIDIETYRGFDIVFDTEEDNFFGYSNDRDVGKTKNNLTSIRRSIDDFIKENQNFKPVKARLRPGASMGEKEIEIIGLRKDKRFIINEKGKNRQLSEYDEKKYILIEDSDNDIYKELESMELEIDLIRKKKTELLNTVKGVSIDQWKKTLSI